MSRKKDWISVGGVLGLAMIMARLTRTPLANFLTLLSFLSPHLVKSQMRYYSHPASLTMTHEEACLILGISSLATKQDILEAHRRLIQKNHPDLGGTDYLAAKINEARDILLR